MRKTTIIELEKIDPKRPILIEGLPGLGLVGKITLEYLIKQLNARKVAELYSPHFAHCVLVDNDGSLRLLRLEFYYWSNTEMDSDLILLTGDCQAQTIEGQYEVANVIFDYAEKNNVGLIITLGGYRKEVKGKPQVFASSTNQEMLDRIMKLGAKNAPSESPIIGAVGITAGLAKFKGIDAVCLLAETYGDRPDPKAAMSLLNILMKMLHLNVDLLDLEKEISRYEELEEKIIKMQEQRILEKKKQKTGEEEKIFYIG